MYWLADASFTGYSIPGVTGTLNSQGGTTIQGGTTGGSDNGSDILALTSAASEGGVITLQGTLTGYCSPAVGVPDTYNCVYQAGSASYPWSLQGTAEPIPSSAPAVATLAGQWQTAYGSILQVSSDGIFTLTDNAQVSPQLDPSNCQFDGQITQPDPTMAIYEINGTVSPLSAAMQDQQFPIQCHDTVPNDAVQGVFALVNGQLIGGMASNNGAFTVIDTAQGMTQ